MAMNRLETASIPTWLASSRNSIRVKTTHAYFCHRIGWSHSTSSRSWWAFSRHVRQLNAINMFITFGPRVTSMTMSRCSGYQSNALKTSTATLWLLVHRNNNQMLMIKFLLIRGRRQSKIWRKTMQNKWMKMKTEKKLWSRRQNSDGNWCKGLIEWDLP